MSEITCEGCGVCCLGMAVPPVGEHGHGIPDDLMAEIDTYIDSPRFNDMAPCLWLDRVTGGCKHYEYRPQTCREFELGGESCLKQRAEAGVDGLSDDQ